jgi:alpha-D-ribose 1-methylphosphonate 5-triphosphate synthase subunit PhnL
MSEEKCPQGQVQTALEKAAKQREKSSYLQNKKLLELTGGLKRITFQVTAQEYDQLITRSGEGTTQTLLESFVADLTRSERSIWKECQDEAQNWLRAHSKAEVLARAYFDSLDEIEAEGGQSC